MAAARARKRMDEDEDLVVAAPQSDAYTGLLVISFLATLTGLIFLFLDYKDYPDKPPNLKQLASPPPAVQSQPATPPGAP